MQFSSLSLQYRYTLLVTAAQWTDCGQMIRYFHSCTPIWCSTWLTKVQAMLSMLYMSSKLNNRNHSTSSICSISCIFCILCIFWDPHQLRGPGGLNRSESQKCKKKQLRDLCVAHTGISCLTRVLPDHPWRLANESREPVFCDDGFFFGHENSLFANKMHSFPRPPPSLPRPAPSFLPQMILYGRVLYSKTFATFRTHSLRSQDTSTSPYEYYFFWAQKFTFCQQTIFYFLFLNEIDRILKSRSSKLHCRFWRSTSLIKTVYLESQCLQSYYCLLKILALKYKEGLHYFAGIEIQAKNS